MTTNTKPITCRGYTLPADVEAGALAFMRQSSPFRALDLFHALRRLGVPEANDVAYRLADRLLQRERKRGSLEVRAAAWRWVAPAPATPAEGAP